MCLLINRAFSYNKGLSRQSSAKYQNTITEGISTLKFVKDDTVQIFRLLSLCHPQRIQFPKHYKEIGL